MRSRSIVIDSAALHHYTPATRSLERNVERETDRGVVGATVAEGLIFYFNEQRGENGPSSRRDETL